MRTQLQFLRSGLRERLWVKPLIACILSIAGVLLARFADSIPVDWKVPEIAQGSVVDLLKIIAASMLGVATFAVASMVAAYASAGQSATARAVPLVVADDVSQNALSIFVGAFIFAIVGLSATTNDYFGKAGRFALFCLTLLSLVVVVLVFVRWVNRIARLGRLGAVIAKVEEATVAAMQARKQDPCLGGVPVDGTASGLPFHSDRSGYLLRIDMAALDRIAGKGQLRSVLQVLPGAMIVPSRALGLVLRDDGAGNLPDLVQLRNAFVVGPLRQYDEDPRFGLVVLAEVACRALSPGINDAGTAIAVLGSLHLLLAGWAKPADAEPAEPAYERIQVPQLAVADMFEDAFPAIARDGAGLVEVAMRLQRVLGDLGRCSDPHMARAARHHADIALLRAERALTFPPDFEQVRWRFAEAWGER